MRFLKFSVIVLIALCILCVYPALFFVAIPAAIIWGVLKSQPSGSKVMGIKNYQSFGRKWMVAPDKKLFVHHEPQNKFDPNTLAVVGVLGNGKQGIMGYVPAEITAKIAKHIPSAQIYRQLDTACLPTFGKQLGLRVSLYIARDAVPRFKNGNPKIGTLYQPAVTV